MSHLSKFIIKSRRAYSLRSSFLGHFKVIQILHSNFQILHVLSETFSNNFGDIIVCFLIIIIIIGCFRTLIHPVYMQICGCTSFSLKIRYWIPHRQIQLYEHTNIRICKYIIRIQCICKLMILHADFIPSVSYYYSTRLLRKGR